MLRRGGQIGKYEWRVSLHVRIYGRVYGLPSRHYRVRTVHTSATSVVSRLMEGKKQDEDGC